MVSIWSNGSQKISEGVSDGKFSVTACFWKTMIWHMHIHYNFMKNLANKLMDVSFPWLRLTQSIHTH